MKKNNNTTIYILLAIFGATALVFLGLFISYFVTSKNYENQIENIYEKNFYEIVSNINGIEVDISKVVATTDKNTQKELLTGIYNTSLVGINNINLLPISYNKLTKINNLLNKIGGFAYSLVLSLDNGDNINESEYSQITNIHSTLRDIQYDLNKYVSGMSDDYRIIDDVDFGSDESEDFSAGIINTESSNSKVPTLIYDGPFSDSVLNKEVLGLGNIEYSKEDITTRLANIYIGYNISYVGESNGKFATYNYNVYVENYSLYVSVSKMGGMILTISSFGGGSEHAENIDGELIAENFAKDLGIKNMYTVWSQTTGNVMYVNLAPIVNKVIYYSDLIKVKVDLSNGDVIGWEATNYATNHISRKFTSSISLSEAEKKISSILTVKERNYCIIPDKYVGELSAYEFICTWENYTYYIYINSNTGAEANILRVVSTTNGDLLI